MTAKFAQALLSVAAFLAMSSPGMPATFPSGELQIPGKNGAATYIAPGHSDGCRVWFTERRSGNLGCVSADMFSIRQVSLPSAGAQPLSIASDQNGTVWVTEFGARKIAAVSTGVKVHEFSLPPNFGAPLALVLGLGSSVWFTSASPAGLRRGSRDGGFRIASLGSRYAPWSLAVDPAGAYLWFAEQDGSRLGRVDAALNVKVYEAFPATGPSGMPRTDQITPAITVTPDHTVWFTEAYVPSLKGAAIGHLDTAGKISYVKIPTADCQPAGILWDGRGIWFTEYRASKVGFLDGAGHIQEFKTQTPHAGPIGLAEDDQGVLWFVERDANKLGWLDLTYQSRLRRAQHTH